MTWRRAGLVVLAAASLAGCGGGATSTYLYDRSATLACLEQRPEFVKKLDFAPGAPVELRARGGRYQSAARAPGAEIPARTPAISVSFNNGIPNLTVLFLEDEPAALRFHRGVLAYVRANFGSVTPGKVLERHRNVIVQWSLPTAPARVRGIVPACLRTARG